MVIGVISWELHLAGSASLKDKRSVLKSLKARLHNEFNVSVAETARHDNWQHAELTACLVATDKRHAESVISSLDRFVEEADGCRVIDTVTSYL
ncbi:MAG TPA: DUF503 domain-containing protein [Gemmatimonadaceae bacterium]|nr:DUF503 domain-containing protein [Gemmatimonadaceae bacterium]